MQSKVHPTLTVKLPVPELRGGGGGTRTHDLNLGATDYCSYIYFHTDRQVRFVNTENGQFTHKIQATLCQRR